MLLSVLDGQLGVQVCRSGANSRLSSMWSEFDAQIRRQMWVEFVGSLLRTDRFFPGTPVSALLNHQKFDLIVIIVNWSYSVPNWCFSARTTRHLNKVTFLSLEKALC